MNDFSMAEINDMAIHLVGNKVKEEGVKYSSELCSTVDDVTKQYLKQYFFTSFKFDLTYQFCHETDVNLNEIYNYTEKIFSNKDTFHEQSINIAKHLYEVSTHPNIKTGELYVTYISNCVIDDKVTDVIGIFKSETKDFYLEVKDSKTRFDVSCKKGINTKKLDKGCLILKNENNVPSKIYVVDMNHNHALYWKNLFLKIEEITDEYTNTSSILKTCKQYIKKAIEVAPTEKVSIMNDSVNYFETHDDFEINDFVNTVFKKEEDSKHFKDYLLSFIPEKKIDDKFAISTKAVSNIKRTLKNFIKLDSKIEIKINTNGQSVGELLEKDIKSL